MLVTGPWQTTRRTLDGLDGDEGCKLFSVVLSMTKLCVSGMQAWRSGVSDQLELTLRRPPLQLPRRVQTDRQTDLIAYLL
jgi:hypothetical protein